VSTKGGAVEVRVGLKMASAGGDSSLLSAPWKICPSFLSGCGAGVEDLDPAA